MLAQQARNLSAVALSADDATLAQRAQQGDERAFAMLYRRHARLIAGVVYRLIGDAAEVDDIVQDTFVVASLNLGALKDTSAVRRWFVTIAVRKARRKLGQRSRRRWLRSELERTSAPISDPSVRREVDELYDVLDSISTKLRIPWMLSRIEGDNLEEVAQTCGVSVATAKRRIAKAETYVRSRLGHG